ncbi:MAG: glycosyltransferase [Nanoarchaeota archaeon]|nr:glycosyltransferase [Nanoarchaeota archaeon]
MLEKKRIKFIPNSIPKEVFNKVDVEAFKKKYNLQNKLVISYLGRIQKYKGLDQVVKVLPDLVKANPNICFLAMGKDSGDMERLKKLAKDLDVSKNIVFASVNDEERLAGLDVSEIFVLPSEWEAFGIVIIEAMARHNAVISTTTEGGNFLIEEGKNGYLYDYKDTNHLRKHLLKLIKDDKLRHKMMETNYSYSKEFSTEKIAKQLEALYKKVLKEN